MANTVIHFIPLLVIYKFDNRIRKEKNPWNKKINWQLL